MRNPRYSPSCLWQRSFLEDPHPHWGLKDWKRCPNLPKPALKRWMNWAETLGPSRDRNTSPLWTAGVSGTQGKTQLTAQQMWNIALTRNKQSSYLSRKKLLNHRDVIHVSGWVLGMGFPMKTVWHHLSHNSSACLHSGDFSNCLWTRKYVYVKKTQGEEWQNLDWFRIHKFGKRVL